MSRFAKIFVYFTRAKNDVLARNIAFCPGRSLYYRFNYYENPFPRTTKFALEQNGVMFEKKKERKFLHG